MADGRIIRRRAFVAGAMASLAACSSEQPRAGLLGLAERWNERVQRALFDPQRLAPELPASATTKAGDFPAYYISPAPPPTPPGWRLRVGGLVATPLALTLDELQQMTRTDLRVRHHCVEGWSAVASWHGVRLRDLAQRVGAAREARYVEFRSFDMGYYSTWDRESAWHPQTILAYGMNGEPLAAPYGAPLRLYGAVKLGYKMVKYLDEVNFLPTRTEGYWEDRGYEWFAGV
jgi:DMSO/TMAO reductase YedYZ molybdopterin-dependent catalytic subunit